MTEDWPRKWEHSYTTGHGAAFGKGGLGLPPKLHWRNPLPPRHAEEMRVLGTGAEILRC